MIDVLDEFYTNTINSLNEALPDGIINIDISVLSDMDLLDDITPTSEKKHFPQCMYAVETEQRVTLFNDYFAAWIVPCPDENNPHTLLLIAKIQNNVPKLEIGFSFRGIHNQAKVILKVLDKAIHDIQEMDVALTHIRE